VHFQPVFADCPAYVECTSERFPRTGLSLPSGFSLSDDQFERVRRRIATFIDKETV